MYILEELKKVLNDFFGGGWKINSQKTVLTFGGIIDIDVIKPIKYHKNRQHNK